MTLESSKNILVFQNTRKKVKYFSLDTNLRNACHITRMYEYFYSYVSN